MDKLYVNNGAWRTVKVIAVRDTVTWRYVRTGYINVNGAWQIFYGGNSGTQSFNVGTTAWTVPDGVFSITSTGCGGGGQGGNGDGGANNDGPGMGGGGANLISGGPYSVTPGDVLTVTVGAGGSGSQGNGNAGGATTISGPGVLFTADGGGGGGGFPGWGGTGLFPGIGVYGATNGSRPAPGLTTNGGANGGQGGPYSRRGNRAGFAGENGKLSITF